MFFLMIFAGVSGVLLDLPASEIVCVQIIAGCIYSVVAGVIDGLKSRHEARREARNWEGRSLR